MNHKVNDIIFYLLITNPSFLFPLKTNFDPDDAFSKPFINWLLMQLAGRAAISAILHLILNYSDLDIIDTLIYSNNMLHWDALTAGRAGELTQTLWCQNVCNFTKKNPSCFFSWFWLSYTDWLLVAVFTLIVQHRSRDLNTGLWLAQRSLYIPIGTVVAYSLDVLVRQSVTILDILRHVYDNRNIYKGLKLRRKGPTKF